MRRQADPTWVEAYRLCDATGDASQTAFANSMQVWDPHRPYNCCRRKKILTSCGLNLENRFLTTTILLECIDQRCWYGVYRPLSICGRAACGSGSWNPIDNRLIAFGDRWPIRWEIERCHRQAIVPCTGWTKGKRVPWLLNADLWIKNVIERQSSYWMFLQLFDPAKIIRWSYPGGGKWQ